MIDSEIVDLSPSLSKIEKSMIKNIKHKLFLLFQYLKKY